MFRPLLNPGLGSNRPPPASFIALRKSNGIKGLVLLILIRYCLSDGRQGYQRTTEMAPPTVITLKTSFLAAQTRLLAQPIAPSRAWRNANDNAEDGIPEKALDDALFRLNQLLQQHSRRVHAPQATRHVAEQIDRLYWDAAERYIEQNDDSGLRMDDLGESQESTTTNAC